MRIYKQYKEPKGLSKKEVVSKKDVIEYCENRGYWKKGSALKVLQEMGKIWTPFAIYTLKK